MELTVQYAVQTDNLPSEADFNFWVTAALPADATHELVIRIVNEEESRHLNHIYRGRESATNVLSFPFDAPPGITLDYLGDLVICASVVAREAAGQNKALQAHWAHIVVHGVLHLRGFDHQNDTEADIMEEMERNILRRLNFSDPYLIHE